MPTGYRRRITLRPMFARVDDHLRDKHFYKWSPPFWTSKENEVEEDEHVIDMVQRSPRASTQWIIVLSIVRRWQSAEHYTRKGGFTYHIQRIQHLEPTWIAGWKFAIGLMLTRKLFLAFCLPPRPILLIVNSTGQSYVCDHDTSQLPKATTKKLFLKNLGDITSGQLIGPSHSHNGLRYFSQLLKQCLSQQFPNRWNGRGGAPYWPPRSPDLNSLFCHAWPTLKPWLMHAKWTQRWGENVWECIN